MDSNHRRPDVSRESSPLDYGIKSKVDSSGIAPESSVCRTDVFLLDHEPDHSLPAEAVGLEPTSEMFPPPVFKTGSSSGRMTSVIFKLRELESNRAPSPWLGRSGFRAQRHYQQQLSRSQCVSKDKKDFS